MLERSLVLLALLLLLTGCGVTRAHEDLAPSESVEAPKPTPETPSQGKLHPKPKPSMSPEELQEALKHAEGVWEVLVPSAGKPRGTRFRIDFLPADKIRITRLDGAGTQITGTYSQREHLLAWRSGYEDHEIDLDGVETHSLSWITKATNPGVPGETRTTVLKRVREP